MELDKVEATLVRIALNKMATEMNAELAERKAAGNLSELAERKAAGNLSEVGDNQLLQVRELITKVEVYLQDEFVPANPLSEYPKTTGL